MKGNDDYAPKTFGIDRQDLEKFGYTAGRRGRRTANRGTTAVGRGEECRKRIAEKLDRIGDERLECEKERLLERLEEKSSKRRSPMGAAKETLRRLHLHQVGRG